MPNLLKQPLVHFLLLGALLFVLYQQQATETEAGIDDTTIVVDRQVLLDYLQYQAQTFDPVVFNERLDAMTPEQRDQLVADYVREEALYREALRMHMDEGDYIIKQRLVQKVEFLLENLVVDSINPTDEQLNAFFAERQQDYRIEPVYSFTHVFFDRQTQGADLALERANELLSGGEQIAFADAARYGDRFPFLQNYVERTRSFVANNFGDAFVAELDKLEPSSSAWYGPVESRHGFHLVMLTDRTETSLPAFAEIRDRVLDDYRYEALTRNRDAAEKEVVEGYELQLNLEATP